MPWGGRGEQRISSIRDRNGRVCEGEELNEEFSRQVESKQGRAADIFPAESDGLTELDFDLKGLVAAVRRRQLKDPGKSGFPTAALKQMTMLSLAALKDVIVKTGKLPCIELILRFVAHLPIRKVPVVNTEEDTRLIALEVLVAIRIMNRTEQYVADRQQVCQAGRAETEVASLVTMTIEHAEEQGSTEIVYKRDRSNAYGTVDLNGVCHLLPVVPQIRQVGENRIYHSGRRDQSVEVPCKDLQGVPARAEDIPASKSQVYGPSPEGRH